MVDIDLITSHIQQKLQQPDLRCAPPWKFRSQNEPSSPRFKTRMLQSRCRALLEGYHSMRVVNTRPKTHISMAHKIVQIAARTPTHKHQL